MGIHNRITKEKFSQIKKEVSTPSEDVAVAKKFEVGGCTVRNIRLSKDYQEYCERVFRFHGFPKGKAKIELYKPSKERLEQLDYETFGEPEEKGAYLTIGVFVIVALIAIVALLGVIVGGVVHAK